MKICLISNLYKPLIIGGAEIYVENIAKALSEKNEVLIITSVPFKGFKSLRPDVEQQDNIKIYKFSPANIYHTYFAKKKTNFIKPIWHMIDVWNPHSYFVIRRILKKENPEIVHTHNLGGISSSALYAAKSCGIPVVHTLHDCSLVCPRATLIHEGSRTICDNPAILCRMYRELKKRSTDKVDVITCPSDYVLNTFNQADFFPSSQKRIMIPLGLNMSLNPKKPFKDTLDLLYIGGIAKHKGIDVLIKAFKGIPTENIRLHIAGTGPYIDEVKMIADDPRITLHGFVSGERKDDLFSLADVCIFPSLGYESFGLVIIESFFHGVPVVGSRTGSIPELIKEGHNGLLFEAGNSIELRNIIQRLISRPDELKRLSEGAIDSAKDYTIQGHINKLCDLYESLIAAN